MGPHPTAAFGIRRVAAYAAVRIHPTPRKATTNMLPLLYVVRMDVEPDYLAEFVAWYDTRHGPDLIATGFLSCSAYHSVHGGPFICNVYEIPSLAVLESDAYVAVRHDDRQLVDEVLHKISNHSNTVYTQEVVVGIPDAAVREDTRPSRAGAVSAPVVSTLRLDVAEGHVGRFQEWLTGEEAQARERAPGFMRMRAGAQSGKHPLFPSAQPDWIVLTEWATAADALADNEADPVVERYGAALGKGAARLEYQVGAHSATLLNTSDWTT